MTSAGGCVYKPTQKLKAGDSHYWATTVRTLGCYNSAEQFVQKKVAKSSMRNLANIDVCLMRKFKQTLFAVLRLGRSVYHSSTLIAQPKVLFSNSHNRYGECALIKLKLEKIYASGFFG